MFVLFQISIKILHRRLKSLKIESTIIENIPDNSSYLCGLNITCPDLEVNMLYIRVSMFNKFHTYKIKH